MSKSRKIKRTGGDKKNINQQISKAVEYYNHNQLDPALHLFEQILKKKPNDIKCLNYIGIIFQKKGLLKESIKYLKKLITISPNNSTFLNNLATSFFLSNDFESSKKYYQKALLEDPDNPHANNGLGNALKKLNQVEEAIAYYQKAKKLLPGNTNVLANLAHNLERAKSKEDYDLAVEILKLENPGNAIFPAFIILMSYFKWDYLPQLLEKIDKVISDGKYNYQAFQSLLFGLLNLDKLPDHKLFEYHNNFAQYASKLYSINGDGFTDTHLATHKKIKIGYVSPDFRHHSVGYFIHNLIANHNKNIFEVYCYHTNSIRDALTNQIIRYSDHFTSLDSLNILDIVKKIKKDDIDILIDLAGHSEDNQFPVFTFRCAPLQVSYLGYPFSSCLSTMDIRITDDFSDIIDQEKYYSESIVKMPNSFLCFGEFPNIPIEKHIIDDNETVKFGCFNSARKLNDTTISIWAKILKKNNNSKLILKSYLWSEKFTTNEILAKKFNQYGVENNRILFINRTQSREEHLALYNQIDIALDTLPYNGTTTTCEALWMGVPVVTLVGEAHRQRVSYSILKNIGVEETITFSEEEYIQTAVSLSKNRSKLNQLKQHVVGSIRNSILCRPTIFTNHFEGTLLKELTNKSEHYNKFHTKHKEQKNKIQINNIELYRSILSPETIIYELSQEQNILFSGIIEEHEIPPENYSFLSTATLKTHNQKYEENTRFIIKQSSTKKGSSYLLVKFGAQTSPIDFLPLLMETPHLQKAIFAYYIQEQEQFKIRRTYALKEMGINSYTWLPNLQLLVPINPNEQLDSSVQELFGVTDIKAQELEKENLLISNENLGQLVLPDIPPTLWIDFLMQARLPPALLAQWVSYMETNKDRQEWREHLFVINLFYFAKRKDSPRKMKYLSLTLAFERLNTLLETTPSYAKYLSAKQIAEALHKNDYISAIKNKFETLEDTQATQEPYILARESIQKEQPFH